MRLSFRFFCSTLLTTATLASSALQATETRMETLNSPVGMLDETDIYTYPGRVPAYSLALIELGKAPENEAQTNAQAYGGILKRFGSSGLGIVLSRDESLMTDGGAASFSLVDRWLLSSASNENEVAILPAPERPVDIFYGGDLGGDSGWGLRLTYASYKDSTKSTSDTPASDKKVADQFDMFAGYSSGGNNRFDLGLGLGLLGTLKQSTETAGAENSDSFKRGLELSLAARQISQLNNANRAFQIQFITRSPKVESTRGTTSESGKFSEKIALLTGGLTFLPSPGVSVATDLNYLFLDSKGPVVDVTKTAVTPSILANPDDDIKLTTHALFTTLAVEAPVAAGFGVLGGMQYTLWGVIKAKDEISETKSEQTVTQTSDVNLWSLGFFYVVDALRIDASYKKNFLHSGPYLVSGDATTDPLMRISASYKL